MACRITQLGKLYGERSLIVNCKRSTYVSQSARRNIMSLNFINYKNNFNSKICFSLKIILKTPLISLL